MTRIYRTEPLTIVKDYRIRYQSTMGQISKFFLSMVNEGKLMGTRCEKCGKTYLPPYPDCPDCNARTSWVEVPNNGVVEAFTVCYVQPRHFKRKLPYVLAYVRLEGVDNLLPGILEADPDKVEEGAKVSLTIRIPQTGPHWGVYEADYFFELVEG